MLPSKHREPYAPGHVLAGRFRIVQFLGRGGMGEVYEAADLDLRQRVALKLIRPESRTDPQLLSMLREEVRQARSVSHANVCRVYDLERDEASEVVFVTMELVRGETLHARLKRDGPFKPEAALPVLRQIADGMDAIHARRMLHMDLKPANVMLDCSAGETPRAIVTDFGLAKSLGPGDSAETTRSVVQFRGGTPGYMSPERFVPGWPVTAAADVYAFGLIAYEMLTGKALASPPGAAPPPLKAVVPDAPAKWDELIKGCIAADPAVRFPSCGAAMGSLNASAIAQPTPPGLLSRYKRGLLLGAGIVAAAVVSFFYWPSRPLASASALRWYNQGVDAIREGTYFKAVRALEQSVKESPGYPLTHASLAEAWLELDSPERAGEEMLRAMAPGSPVSRMETRDRDRLQAIHNTLTREFEKATAGYARLAETVSNAERPGALVDLGRALERSKQPRKAMEKYESALHFDPNYAGAWLRLAVIEGQLQLSDKMAEALQRAETLYEAASNMEGETEVFYQRGAYANRQSRLNDAAEWLGRARQSALATHNPHQQIRALYQLSAVAYQRGDTVEAEKLAQQAVDDARSNNIEFLAGRGFLELGNAMFARGEFDKATEYFNRLLGAARNYHNGRLEATALYSLGTIANRTHVDEAGEHQIEQALAWFQPNGFPVETSLCLVWLGRIRRDRGDLTGAAEAFNKQSELARAAHDDLQTVLGLSSLASIMIRQDRFPEALELTLRQQPISQRMGDDVRVAYEQNTLARLYAELGRFAESAAAADSAESTARARKLEELMANVAVARARSLLLAGRLAEAAKAADQAIRTYQTKYPQEAGELLGIMAEARRAPFHDRWEWCERGLKLGRGSAGLELSLKLTKAELLLENRNAQAAFDLCAEIRGSLERQQIQYSLFREELVAAMAAKELGRDDAHDALARASSALERFFKPFSDSDKASFRARPDFQRYEKELQKMLRQPL